MTSNKWDAPKGTSDKWDGTLEDAQALYEGRKRYCRDKMGGCPYDRFEDHCRDLQNDALWLHPSIIRGWRKMLEPDATDSGPRPVAMAQALREAQDKIKELERDIGFEKEKNVSMSSSVMWYANRHDETSKANLMLMDEAQEARADLASSKEALRLVRAALRSVGMEEAK